MIGRPDYDPNQIAMDGPFAAPRKWLHVQKILIGVTVGSVANNVLLGLMPYPWPWWHAFLVGPAIVLAKIILERFRPTDPNPHTLAEHLTDTVTDCALYSGPAVLYYVRVGRWATAAIVAGFLFSIYRAFRAGARP